MSHEDGENIGLRALATILNCSHTMVANLLKSGQLRGKSARDAQRLAESGWRPQEGYRADRHGGRRHEEE